MKKKYLLIGSIPTKNPQSYGGTTILMKQMINYFDENQKNYIFIQANIYDNKFGALKNYIYIIVKTILNIHKVDLVMVNVARNGAFLLSPIIYILAKLFRKKFIFRIFGGNFIDLYRNNKLRTIIANLTFIKSDIIFVETKEILKFVQKINKNTYWFPNTRKQTLMDTPKKEYNKRFVFISSVKETKGIDQIVDVFNQLDTMYQVDIYGPIQDKKYSEQYFTSTNTHYKGVIKPENVVATLYKYDVLLLPTFHRGEGYPGIIIEAYSIGIPNISTRWQAIPEIVDDYQSGILIEPKSSKSLLDAIRYINKENYPMLSKHALEKFETFRYENVYKSITNICEELK